MAKHLTIDPQRHQKSLLRVTLVLVFLVSLVVGSLNFWLLDAYRVGTFNFISVVAAVSIAAFYWRTRNLNAAAWALCIAVIFNLLAFIHQAQGAAYSLIWITILPPFVFFLLGRKAGAWITASVFVYVIVFMLNVMPNLEPSVFSTGALLNVIEVLIAHFFLFLHYERSRAEAYRELEKLSLRDKLTGLYNRGKLDSELERLQSMLIRHQQHFSIILLDIDFFKKVNDQYGHVIGDHVLRELSKLLIQQKRDTDQVGRWGGEEFMVLCPNTRADEAANCAERLRHAIMTTELAEGVRLSASFGVAEAGRNESVETLVNRADQALYQAKAQGRNQVVIKT